MYKFFICHVHHNYSEAVIANENVESQVSSNDAQTICKGETRK